MTKFSFVYFVVLIVPVLFAIRLRNGGLRSASAWFIALACGCAPAIVYLIRYGRSAFAQARAASFGGLSGLYHVPLLQFLGSMIRESPGLGFSTLLMAAALIYVMFKGKALRSWPEFTALLIMIGFLIIVLESPSKQDRYLFPALVTVPFLLAILISRQRDSVSAPSHVLASLASTLIFVGLVLAAIPTRHRPDWQSLSRTELVLAQAAGCKAKHIVLATDSPTLNIYLMGLDLEFSDSAASATTLAYQAVSGIPIEDDFRAISEADLVVFQDARHTNPKFSNQRAPDYERYIRQGGYAPITVGDDLRIYAVHCKQ